MNAWLTRLLFLGITFPALPMYAADTGQIRGSLLLDPASKRPYQGCLILMAIKRLSGEQFQVLKFARAKTDQDGRFVLKDLPTGSHLIFLDAPCHGSSFDERSQLKTKIGNKDVPLEVKLEQGQEIDLGQITVTR
jgi:hypothetical protein